MKQIAKYSLFSSNQVLTLKADSVVVAVTAAADNEPLTLHVWEDLNSQSPHVAREFITVTEAEACEKENTQFISMVDAGGGLCFYVFEVLK